MSSLIVLQNCATIQLTKGQNALVDAQDLPSLSRRKWCVSRCGRSFYAVRHTKSTGKQIRIYMHRAVLEMVHGTVPDGMNGDHKNRDTLDNRSNNLRITTIGQNRSNSCKKLWRGGKSSDFKGVSFHKGRQLWRAVIVKDKKQ